MRSEDGWSELRGPPSPAQPERVRTGAGGVPVQGLRRSTGVYPSASSGSAPILRFAREKANSDENKNRTECQ